MSPVVRLSDTTWERLKGFAEPLSDTPDDAVRKILDVAETCRSSHKIPSAVHTVAIRQASPANASLSHPRGTKRLVSGQRTPVDAYRTPILRALLNLGGKARAQDVLRSVHIMMADTLNEFDGAKLSTGGERWHRTAN